MVYIDNQFIIIRNVLSHLARVHYRELGDYLRHIITFGEAVNIDNSRKIMFRVLKKHENGKDIILDLEMLIPVREPFESNEKHIFKPEFRLENAIMIYHYGSIDTVLKSADTLYTYIFLNGLKVLTEPYYVVNKNDGSDSIVSIYVGLNGNIV